jgi:hypothetical protein
MMGEFMKKFMQKHNKPSFAIGSNCHVLEEGTLGTRETKWEVDGDKFTLSVGDATVKTKVTEQETAVLRDIFSRLHGQLIQQEGRL